ncbi:MAG: hypothetical protein JWQ98_2578 [Chlorobi bacterium]|nr:hypothetical protein [Chlorobiota bacterium]
MIASAYPFRHGAPGSMVAIPEAGIHSLTGVAMSSGPLSD